MCWLGSINNSETSTLKYGVTSVSCLSPITMVQEDILLGKRSLTHFGIFAKLHLPFLIQSDVERAFSANFRA